MSESHQQGPAPSQDLEETRDELAQASMALNTAYDRLQDLRSSLRTFAAQRDRLTGARTRDESSPPGLRPMGPDHSAIVLSDSDEESEVDIEFLRESLPTRLLELTARWGDQHDRLSVAAHRPRSAERDSESATALSLTSSSTSPMPIYPPPRRRRPAPPTSSSSREGANTSPGTTSPARRSILEAHLRQMRHAANPGEPSTTLGRRVAQRAAAAAAQGTATGHQSSAAVTPPSNIIHSTLPLGLEPRPSPAGFVFASPHESRAAAHLRHSLLPNPPGGIRPTSGVRTSIGGSLYSRFGERAEHRPRTARSNSFTAISRPAFSTTNVSRMPQQSNTSELSTQTPLSSRLGQIRAAPLPLSEEAVRFGFNDAGSASYRVRRRVNAQGEEQVFNINWNELMSDGERDEDLSDPAAWMRPPRQPTRMRPDRPRTQPDPETDDTVVHDSVPASSREARPIGRDSGAQRRRGWARLDADGDEISTEDEATFERARAESRLPRTRNWARGGTAWAAGRGSTVAVLDFVHHNSRDATTGHRDPNLPLDRGHNDNRGRRRANSPRRILDNLFRSSAAYISPLPVPLRDCLQTRQYDKEVQVKMDEQMMAGR